MANPADRIVRIRNLIGALELRSDVDALLNQLSTLSDLKTTSTDLREFAERYTAAWCSQKAESVASFYSSNGSLCVNYGAAALGRDAITCVARGFMSDFPDMIVLMDDLLHHAGRAVYCRTLIGTNTGPGGTGKSVRISGCEVWRFGDDGLIAESLGHFDGVAYQHQLEHGHGD